MHFSFAYLSCLTILSTTLYGASTYAAADVSTRQMGASCAACHGTNGNSVGATPVLAGLDRKHFIRQMRDFKSGARPATVMHRHAKGYSDAEIEKLADYFAAQKRTP